MHASTYMHVMDLAVVCVQAAPGGGAVLRGAQPRTCAPHSPAHVRRSTSAGWRGWMARQGLQGIYACMVDDAVNFYEKCESFFRIPICTETLKKWLLGFQNIILFLFSMNP